MAASVAWRGVVSEATTVGSHLLCSCPVLPQCRVIVTKLPVYRTLQL